MMTLDIFHKGAIWRSPTLYALSLIAIMTTALPALAIDPDNPDWPCVQRKVLTLTASQIWDGPAISEQMPWRKSGEIYKLVTFLMSRRVPIEEAEKAIEKFAAAQPKDKKDEQLTLLFAGFLDQTNARRSKIIKGIEKINLRQRARAEELEKKGVALSKMEERLEAGEKGLEKKIEEAQKAYDWDARIFKERQENIPLACEIPVLIEQRAFAISQAIRAQMDN